MILETAAAGSVALANFPGIPAFFATVAPYLTGPLWGSSAALSEWLNWHSPPRANMETATNTASGVGAMSTMAAAVSSTLSGRGVPALIFNAASGASGAAGTSVALLNAWLRTPRDWARLSPYLVSGSLNYISTGFGAMSTKASREGDDVSANYYGMLSGVTWGAGAVAPYVIERLTRRKPSPQSAASMG